MLQIFVYMLIVLRTKAVLVDRTFLKNAVAKGAVCLDGTPPVYHLDRGSEAGINSWLVHIEATKLYFRGARIFVAVMEELLEKGMKNAENAILSGSSAGGLTSILHCDNFSSLVPKSAKVKCISDAGYFINVKDISGASYIEDYYNDVVMTHGAAKNLPSSCTSKGKPGLCFFPQNIAQQIRTPLFVTNSAYDSWQIRNILAPNISDPNHTWLNCKKNISNCSPSQLQTIQGFRLAFINALTGIGASTSRGYFINSCYTHGQTEGETWFGIHSPVLNNKTIAKAVGDWFYDRSQFQQIDCPYPCNKTCPNSTD